VRDAACLPPWRDWATADQWFFCFYQQNHEAEISPRSFPARVACFPEYPPPRLHGRQLSFLEFPFPFPPIPSTPASPACFMTTPVEGQSLLTPRVVTFFPGDIIAYQIPDASWSTNFVAHRFLGRASNAWDLLVHL